MARYTGPVCRLCRRENQKLYLKGERCYTDKCGLNKRPTAPGQHGARRSKLSGYGVQLREKQKVKRYYGILEGQFREVYERAIKLQGIQGDNLLRLLELRFDNVVYRMGFASSRKEARQLVGHGHFTLNGKKADIPSMTLKVGDVVEVKDKSKSSSKFKEVVAKATTSPKWIEADADKLTGKIVASPVREDIDLPIEEHLIIELYSK
jgi:small subunit ribosomal protein S4